ncbi:HEAT repeat domain-containing protein [Synechococcus sp. LTW-R]|uniref:HEAT repeat domain-containing protein n=1 Tax=Synechococcus sp. LTW-R TaxID=2751170 RepID=UPI0016231AFF|nr:HEAT repeat domain-containing protein [Synechococcus sp. LTW-R]QNG28762.1 HEAT repeat domain-containing protein [Synechococcus sp. LTW-R]
MLQGSPRGAFFVAMAMTQESFASEGMPIDEEEALRRLEQRDDAADRYYAAWWLGHERSLHPRTLPLLRKALQELLSAGEEPDEDSRTLGLNVLRAMVHLDSSSAREEILSCLIHHDSNIREEATRTAASEGLLESVAVICSQLNADDLTNDRLIEAQIEALGDLGDASAAVIETLVRFTGDLRPLIRSASLRAMLLLTADAKWATDFPSLLQSSSTLVRRGVLLDLGAVGWIPALDWISQSPTENSIKLIALRGLAEHPRGHEPLGMTDEQACQMVLQAMDQLL